MFFKIIELYNQAVDTGRKFIGGKISNVEGKSEVNTTLAVLSTSIIVAAIYLTVVKK